jgi:hypothetical protein
MRLVIAVFVVAIAACAHPATSPLPHVTPFIDTFAAAIAARDARAAAARFAPDAELSVSAGPALHGRSAIAHGFDELFARFANTRVAVGRQWIGRDASAFELVFAAARNGKPIGVVAAAVVTFDRAGEVVTARLFIDVPTIVGQIDPSRLPEGARPRAPVTSPPAGTAVSTTTGTTTEAANLAVADASWARLDAHDPDGILAAATPDFLYEDYAGPAPLDLAGTHALLERWLGLVPDFMIAAKPTHFAAGEDVITESIEQMTFHGRAITLRGLDVKHFERGRVTHEWQYANSAGSLHALFGITFEVP